MRLLLIEDEKRMAQALCEILRLEKYEVDHYVNGLDGLAAVESDIYDIVILDVMLPGMNGFEICRKIREHHNYPVIMLTAKDAEVDKITGLTLGADDYITKPFRPLEMVARVKAQLRRYKKYNPASGGEEDGVLCHAGLTINVTSHECTLNGQRLELTPTEFEILKILCQRRGRVVSSEELFHEIWKDEYYQKSNNTITVHIRHLREKLGDTAERPKYIHTVWGVGYKIEN